MFNPKLLEAIDKGDEKGVKSIIDQPFNVNAIEPEMHDSYLHHAAFYDKKGTITKMLIDKGADPNIQNINGVTPLIYAVINGLIAVVKVLLDSKIIKLDMSDKLGHSALFYAVQYMRHDIMALLLKKKASMDVKEAKTNNSLVHLAVINNDMKALDILLKNNAKIDQANVLGDLPIHISASKGDKAVDIVSKLAKKASATLAVQGNNKMTPLHLAVAAGSQKLIKVMKYYNKAVLVIKDILDRTAKDIAMELGLKDLEELL